MHLLCCVFKRNCVRTSISHIQSEKYQASLSLIHTVTIMLQKIWKSTDVYSSNCFNQFSGTGRRTAPRGRASAAFNQHYCRQTRDYGGTWAGGCRGRRRWISHPRRQVGVQLQVSGVCTAASTQSPEMTPCHPQASAGDTKQDQVGSDNSPCRPGCSKHASEVWRPQGIGSQIRWQICAQGCRTSYCRSCESKR